MILWREQETKQRLVIWIGVLLVVASGVYPPWIRVGVIEHAGSNDAVRYEVRQYVYGPIFRPPAAVGQIREDEPDLGLLAGGMADALNWTIHLDLERLIVQWATVCFAVFGLELVLRKSLPKMRR